MNKSIKAVVVFLCFLCILIVAISCKDHTPNNTDDKLAISEVVETPIEPKKELSKDFKTYWYSGEAEITSYKLEQARYGEMREGKAVLVFVTEDFLPKIQVKADNYNASNIPVLKLNATKNFNTGIYPYSIMQSIFYPVANNKHAIKISSSMQEWCGHVYTQLNNREDFEISSHSYFQGEADQTFKLEKTWTENELWTKLRLDPNSLPIGNISIIPSLEFIRLRHKSLKSYSAVTEMNKGSYIITYPELNRILKIDFNTEFPYEISGWEESFVSGFGASAKTMTTKATKLESIKSAYWGKNRNSDESLRDTLKLR